MNKFVVKLVANGVIVVVMLMALSAADFWRAAGSALVFTILAYWIGDQLVLKASNNTIAAIADGILAFVYFWSVADLFDWNLTVLELLMISIALGVAEGFYHRYLAHRGRTAR